MTATDLFDKIIEELNKRLKESDDYTSYDQAQDYAIKVADTTSQLVIDNISNIAKNEQYNTLDYNYCNELLTKLLKEDYQYIKQVCLKVQKALNEASNIHLREIAPDYDDDRAHSIIWESANKSIAEFKRDLPVMTDNYCQSIVDNAVRKNADFQWKSGLEPKIVRTAEYKCCKWCSNLEGSYRYEDVKDTGNDVFRRHENCRCKVTYIPTKGNARDVWSKREVSKNYLDIIQSLEKDKMEQLEETTHISLSKANMFNSHSNMYKLAEKVKPLDGYDDIFIHGDTFSFAIEDADGKQTTYTVAEIADFIKTYPNFKNDKIRLCSCNTGRDSAIAAQLMADITGKEVMAPNNYLWLIDKGDETQLLIAGEIAEKIDYNDLGEWVTFTPKGRRQKE